MNSKWIFADPVPLEQAQELAGDLCPFIGELLCRKGITSLSDASSFLHPRLQSLSDPFLLPDMRKAVERLMLAFSRQERVVLYGDYDVDGITSLTLLDEILRAYGLTPNSFVPARLDEGYGLSADGLERCLQEYNPQLLIAVDCGTGSIEEIASLRERGIDVIVLDHHECKGDLPDCSALVNPKRGDDFNYLCSVGIVFKLCHALLKAKPIPTFDLKDHLDLVAVGTVADLVPLIGENRILVRHGIKRMENTPRLGLQKLMEVSGVNIPIQTSDIGFRIGPRINASGRLGSAVESLELLKTYETARAHDLALILDEMNRERQEVERKTFAEAEKMVEEKASLPEDAAIVVGARGWHIGVIGIVASRLMRKYHRPTLVVGFDEDGNGKGSGRSIEGLSLVEALEDCAHYLEQFGGHEMAVGLTIHEKRFEDFRKAFLKTAERRLTKDQLCPHVHLDVELPLDSVGLDVLEAYDLLQPFGMGNPQPLFYATNLMPSAEPRVLKEKHLLLRFIENGQQISAIFFGGAQDDLPPPPWDIAFQVVRNEFKGSVSAQVQVQALRASA